MQRRCTIVMAETITTTATANDNVTHSHIVCWRAVMCDAVSYSPSAYFMMRICGLLASESVSIWQESAHWRASVESPVIDAMWLRVE